MTASGVGLPVAADTLTEGDRAAIAWELTGMLGIEICPLGDGWVLDPEQVVAWWAGLAPRTRAVIVGRYRRIRKESTDG